MKLQACSSREQVEGVVLSGEICRAAAALTSMPRQRLQALIDAALARFPEAVAAMPDDDGVIVPWPGPPLETAETM